MNRSIIFIVSFSSRHPFSHLSTEGSVLRGKYVDTNVSYEPVNTQYQVYTWEYGVSSPVRYVMYLKASILVYIHYKGRRLFTK